MKVYGNVEIILMEKVCHAAYIKHMKMLVYFSSRQNRLWGKTNRVDKSHSVMIKVPIY